MADRSSGGTGGVGSTGSAGAAAVPEAQGGHRALVAAVAGWRRELAGLGGPQPLMSPTDLHEGSLDLATAHPSGIAMLLAGRPTRLSHLFREPGVLVDARRRARAIRQASAALADEHGLRACVLAVGLASWRDERTGDVVSTPVLLRPVELRPRGSGQVDYEVDLGGPVRTNPALVREMVRRGVPLDPQGLAGLSVHSHGFDPTPSLERLRSMVRVSSPDVQVRSGLLVTALVDVAPALVAELERVAPRLEDSDVALSLAGDPAARRRLHDPGLPAALPESARRVSTEDVRVLALDHYQRRVLDAVLVGRSLRVEAGPGTGATQLVAAAVAALAAAGRRVLLVTGQQVEAEDVARRLAGLGLVDLVVDPAGAPPPSATGPLSRVHAEPERVVAGRRDPVAELHGHHRALHAVRSPWGVSALDALHALSRPTTATTTVRLSGAALRTLDATARDEAGAQLREAVELGALTVRAGDTPWTGAALTSPEDATEALAAVRALLEDLLPALRRQAAALASGSGLREPVSVAECAAQLQLLTAVRDSLDLFVPAVFERPLTPLVEATATPAERAVLGVRLGMMERRRLERAARDLVRPGVVAGDLHACLVAAEEAREAWEVWQVPELLGALPRVPQGVPAAEVVLDGVAGQLAGLTQVLAPTSAGGDLLQAPWADLEQRLVALAQDASALEDLPRRTALMSALEARGLAPLLEDLRERQVPADRVVAELELAWWRSVLEAARADDPDLAGLDPARRGEVVAALAAEERRRSSSAVRRVHEATALAGTPPCRVTSPLALPHEVPPAERQDVVLLIAAHRIGVPEAVLAMASGRQVLVVGDPGGLPPARVAPRQGTAGPPAARRSVFDALDGVLPSVRLECQHRMPAQLAELATMVPGAVTGAYAVPGAPGQPAVQLRLVPEVTGRPDEEGVVESPDGEVAKVVDLVTEHARTRPHESLAVIALTRPHARRIADALRAVLPERPELAAYLTSRRGESFVVTDVERCADTVRDAVLVTVGFGLTPLGRFVHRFGPLDEPDGHRGLAVALTRARHRLTVVSCVSGTSLEEGRLRSPGSRALREVLLALESGEVRTDPLGGVLRREDAASAAWSADRSADRSAAGSAHGSAADGAAGPDADGRGSGHHSGGDHSGGDHSGGSRDGRAVPGSGSAEADPGSRAPGAGRQNGTPPAHAGSNGSAAPTVPTGPAAPVAVPADPLLAALALRLGERGLRCVVGSPVPDLVVLPADSEAPAVAVLTDLPDDPAGAGEGAATAGDLLQRELLLPEELVRFGWRTVRVGAIDLFGDPAAAARRVARELEATPR